MWKDSWKLRETISNLLIAICVVALLWAVINNPEKSWGDIIMGLIAAGIIIAAALRIS